MDDNLFDQAPSPGGFLSGTPYWSSSEIDASSTEVVIFGMGIPGPGYNDKNSVINIYIRPIRAFNL